MAFLRQCRSPMQPFCEKWNRRFVLCPLFPFQHGNENGSAAHRGGAADAEEHDRPNRELFGGDRTGFRFAAAAVLFGFFCERVVFLREACYNKLSQ